MNNYPIRRPRRGALTELQELNICLEYIKGKSKKDLAEEYKVSIDVIKHALRRQSVKEKDRRPEFRSKRKSS